VRPSIRHVWAADNTPIQIKGEVRLPFKLDEKCLWTTALVSEDVEQVVFGIDWLEAHRCVWDFKTGELCISGQLATILSRCRQDRVQCAKSKISKNQQSTQDLSQASAGEAISELQQQDSDIGPILRLRIQQTNQPQPKEIFSESEMNKVLLGTMTSLSYTRWRVVSSTRSEARATDNVTTHSPFEQTNGVHTAMSRRHDRWTSSVSSDFESSSKTWFLARMAPRR